MIGNYQKKITTKDKKNTLAGPSKLSGTVAGNNCKCVSDGFGRSCALASVFFFPLLGLAPLSAMEKMTIAHNNLFFWKKVDNFDHSQ